MTLKMIKIGATGEQLPADAKEWVAVELPDHGLVFSAASVVDSDVPHAKCEAACAALTLTGHSDWDLPSIGELQLLIDRSRSSPAINVDFFPTTKNDWYWTKTPAAWSAASAWVVDFDYGSVSYDHRSDSGFALAVRRPGQSLAL